VPLTPLVKGEGLDGHVEGRGDRREDARLVRARAWQQPLKDKVGRLALGCVEGLLLGTTLGRGRFHLQPVRCEGHVASVHKVVDRRGGDGLLVRGGARGDAVGEVLPLEAVREQVPRVLAQLGVAAEEVGRAELAQLGAVL